MRVLHFVTMLSPDGAFGGPVRVAGNQAAELRARGHEVLVAAGSRGYPHGAGPQELDGTPLHLEPLRSVVPRAGHSGLFSAPLWWWARRALAEVDLVHVHLARDLVTLPVAALAAARGKPLVLQPHGMVVESSHPLARPLDALLTRRVLARADAVLHLTPQEEGGLRAVAGGPVRLAQLGNGVPTVTAAPDLPDRPEVLFCARLQERKRPLLFARMARQLLDEGVQARFTLVGPDEGEGDAVAAEVAAVGDPERLRWEGALEPSRTLARMAEASMLVLPSVDEPYPMAVLEAMSVGRPVLVTQSCGLAAAVRAHRCGYVVDESYDALVATVRRALAGAAELRETGARAAVAAREMFGMEAVVDRLEGVYAEALARHASR